MEETLAKCQGKEAILFSVLAEKHQAMNGLNSVFLARLSDSDCEDNLSLLQLYLSVFHPAYLCEAESMLSKYGGGEKEVERLFAKLAEKFRSTNPLTVRKIAAKKAVETVTKNDSLETCLSIPQSPVMIATR